MQQNNYISNELKIDMFSGLKSDSLDDWLDLFVKYHSGNSVETLKIKQRDIAVFLDYMMVYCGNINRIEWKISLSRSFHNFIKVNNNTRTGNPYSDKTINRILTNLKTFANWIHKIKPFPVVNPMDSISRNLSSSDLKVENYITPEERIKILSVADELPLTAGISKDKNRNRKNKPKLKNRRPFRDRAIIYILIETGIRRTDVVNLSLDYINLKKGIISFRSVGQKKRTCFISTSGLNAISDYISNERHTDNMIRNSSYLFLPYISAKSVPGKLTISLINKIWNNVCKIAGIEGKTPHSARHAMGKYIMETTGNPKAVQAQLGHSSMSYSYQYGINKDEDMSDILNRR